jgi:hypothetical protein
MERPRPGPTGIVDDSTWTGIDPRQEGRIEGGFGEQRKRALFVTLFWLLWGTEGYTYWRTRTRSWHSSRNRDRGHQHWFRGHGKAVGNESFPGWRIGPIS